MSFELDRKICKKKKYVLQYSHDLTLFEDNITMLVQPWYNSVRLGVRWQHAAMLSI